MNPFTITQSLGEKSITVSAPNLDDAQMLFAKVYPIFLDVSGEVCPEHLKRISFMLDSQFENPSTPMVGAAVIGKVSVAKLTA